MNLQIEHPGGDYRIDTTNFHDLTISVGKTVNVNCYYLEEPKFEYYASESFSGSLDAGGSVNCEKISLYAHGSGTHTECALHVLKVDFDMRTVKVPILQLCELISVKPIQEGEDKVINNSCFEGLENKGFEALIVRTIPNDDSKMTANYSGMNPAYFHPDTLSYLRDLGYKHIITDLPSIDRESDEGRLAAHKNWFTVNGVVPPDRTITELVYIPDSIPDANYFVSIQFPLLETDAVLSKILIYPCV